MKYLSKHLSWLKRRINHVSSENIDDKQRASVERSIICECPVCHENLDEHFYCVFASEIVEPAVNMSSLVLRYITERQWIRASEIKEWHPHRDVREYQLIKCPKSMQLSLVVIVFLHELHEHDYIESSDVLGEEDTRQLVAYVGEKWKSL